MNELDNIKRDLFFALLNDVGRVYVHVIPSMELEIGRRGLVGDELENGITLVFNSKMKFTWDEFGIEATLVFGTTPEKCFFPVSAIGSVYSPEIDVQLVDGQVKLAEDKAPSPEKKISGKTKNKRTFKRSPSTDKHEGKVIEVDFMKKDK